MARLGGSDEIGGLLRRVQQNLYRSKDEMLELLRQIELGGVAPDQVVWTLSHREREVREFGQRILLSGRLDQQVVDAILDDLAVQPEQTRHQMAAVVMRAAPDYAVRQMGRTFSSYQCDFSSRNALRSFASTVLTDHPVMRSKDVRKALSQLKEEVAASKQKEKAVSWITNRKSGTHGH